MPTTIEVATADDLAAMWRTVLDHDARIGVLEQAKPAPLPPQPSGFWLSGGSEHTGVESELTRWEDFRRRKCTTATVYTTRDRGWPTFVSSHATSGQIAVYRDAGLDIVIQTSPFPVDQATGATYAAVLRGEYDAEYRKIAQLLYDRAGRRGQPDTLSLAWEANGGYMLWGGGPNRTGYVGHYTSPQQYRDAFGHIVGVLWSVFFELPVIWTINGHGTPKSCAPSGDTWELFPGWDVVTGVGIDDYDHYPKALTKEAFDARARADGGIEWLAAKVRDENIRLFAANRLKRVNLSVPEWGVNGNPKDIQNGVAGGDNPLYVGQQFETFSRLHGEGILKREFYYADPTRIAGNVDSSLLDGNPNAAAEYRRRYAMT